MGVGDDRAALPDYYETVAADILDYCGDTAAGKWMDLGCGSGQVAFALAETCDAEFLLVDSDATALEAAAPVCEEEGFTGRMQLICGCAEALPVADATMDVVVSRGSIFFWDDPVNGLREVFRVLCGGGSAVIGGGLGKTYPNWARREFAHRRYEMVAVEGPDAVAEFHRLRSPKTFHSWAKKAGLRDYRVISESDDETRPPIDDIGIWLKFSK